MLHWSIGMFMCSPQQPVFKNIRAITVAHSMIFSNCLLSHQNWARRTTVVHMQTQQNFIKGMELSTPTESKMATNCEKRIRMLGRRLFQ